MSACVIFGGSGFIGTHLAQRLRASGRFQSIRIADIRPTPLSLDETISFSRTDVREPIAENLVPERPSWIFNLAAIHREPGHEPREYFDTNLAGARNVCNYAHAIGCRNIYFTSSISVYGQTDGPTSEAAAICPISPYGASKYPAELIHEHWVASQGGRRLVICRPGVVYGPGDPGNILRMIRAVKRGYFAIPGSPNIRKSYAYIFGMLDSIDFVMDREEQLIVYNYVESPTDPLGHLVSGIKEFLDVQTPVFRVPIGLLVPAARAAYLVLGDRTPIHPVRVRKAAMSTHIVPQTLNSLGFVFKYPFMDSLKHWKSVAPGDFD